MSQVKLFFVDLANIQTLETQVNQWLTQHAELWDLIERVDLLAFPGTPPKVFYQIMYDETRLPPR